jgi:hypothetical protein
MQTASSLNSIKEWLESLILSERIELKRPDKSNRTDNYKLVTPAVHIGFIPPDKMLGEVTGIRIPCLVVGTSETDGDADSTMMNLQITAIVYDPGLQNLNENGLQLTPNFDGYITLLNFLDRLKDWIQRTDGITDRFQLESSVKLKTYEEQPWPYWYGALTFTVSGEPYPVTKYADVLN